MFKFLNLFSSKDESEQQESLECEESIETDDFEDSFFKAVQNGEESQRFLSLSSQRDCAIIRSLLSADNIPSYTEGEHMNNIYGGLAGTMNAVVAIKLYILKKDYETAYEIVSDFMNSKIKKFNEENSESKASDIITGAVSALFFNAVPLKSRQEGLGIIIFPKEE